MVIILRNHAIQQTRVLQPKGVVLRSKVNWGSGRGGGWVDPAVKSYAGAVFRQGMQSFGRGSIGPGKNDFAGRGLCDAGGMRHGFGECHADAVLRSQDNHGASLNGLARSELEIVPSE
jgi:hypothetical protein